MLLWLVSSQIILVYLETEKRERLARSENSVPHSAYQYFPLFFMLHHVCNLDYICPLVTKTINENATTGERISVATCMGHGTNIQEKVYNLKNRGMRAVLGCHLIMDAWKVGKNKFD